MQKRLPISKRLKAAFLSVALLGALSGAVGLFMINAISHQADVIFEEKYPIAQEAEQLSTSIEAELLAIHSLLLGEHDALQLLEEWEDKTNQHIENLSQVIQTTEERDLLKEIRMDYKAYQTLEKQIVEMVEKKVEQSEIMELLASMEGEINQLTSDVVSLAELAGQDMTKAMERADKLQTNSQISLILITIISFIGAAWLGQRVSNGITLPLKGLVENSRQIAEGNLTVQVSGTDAQDELGDLALAFHTMTEGLRKQIAEIIDGTTIISSSVSELSASSAQLASSAAENATSITETSTTLEEIRQTSELANSKAEQMAEDSLRLRNTSQQGKEATADTIAGMQKIQNQMSTIAETIISLSEQSQAIGQIIATVDSLSEQSNVLAVNASIEAAKAGEQGKGFSVVAQEVKSLAEQSKQATTQVRNILNEIQKATSTAVMATEQGNKVVEKGTDTANQAGQSIVSLAGSLDQSADSATQIAAASQQQRVGMDQITAAMESVSQASQQNATSARQLEGAVQTLNDLGIKLKSIVNCYNI